MPGIDDPAVPSVSYDFARSYGQVIERLVPGTLMVAFFGPDGRRRCFHGEGPVTPAIQTAMSQRRQQFLGKHLARQIESLIKSEYDPATGLWTRHAVEKRRGRSFAPERQSGCRFDDLYRHRSDASEQ